MLAWLLRGGALLAIGAWFLPWIDGSFGMFKTAESAFDLPYRYLLWVNLLLLLPVFIPLRRCGVMVSVALVNTAFFAWKFSQINPNPKVSWSFAYGFYAHLGILFVLLVLSIVYALKQED